MASNITRPFVAQFVDQASTKARQAIVTTLDPKLPITTHKLLNDTLNRGIRKVTREPIKGPPKDEFESSVKRQIEELDEQNNPSSPMERVMAHHPITQAVNNLQK